MNQNLIERLKTFVVRGDYVLSSGERSEFYVDVKKAYGDPETLGLLTDALGRTIDQRTTCIAAADYGGIAPAAIIAKEHKLYLALIRKKPKEHGTMKLIDAHVPTQKDFVYFVDDVFTSGESVRRMIDAVRLTGAQILGCSVVVKRGETDLGFPLRYLCTLEELV